MNQINEMTTEQAAAAYVGLGWRILPICPADHSGVTEHHLAQCHSPGKVPRLSDWRSQASSDLDVVSSWFGRWSNSNLGMVLGSAEGIIAIDVDGEYGKKKLEELSEGDLPDTLQFSTPGGGWRYLYKPPTGANVRRIKDACPSGGHEELAVLSDGQMTVLPPSIHQNGGIYSWLPGRSPGEVELATAPDWMLVKETTTTEATQAVTQTEQSNLRHRKGADYNDDYSINSALATLDRHCPACQRFIATQQEFGCDENTWFNVVNMLVKAGFPKAAHEFSAMSIKYADRSEERIVQLLEKTDSTHGPTRCTTFGCDSAQITSCFGKLHKNKKGEISNTPVNFLSKDKPTLPLPISVNEKANLLPGKYAIESDGMCAISFNGNGERKAAPLANFFAWLNKTITRDNGLEKQQLYEIEGIVLSNHKRLSPIVVPAEDFETMKWVSKWGPEPNIEPGVKTKDYIRHIIQSTAESAEQEYVFSHLGWVKFGNEWKYLHADGAVASSNIKVELDPKFARYRLPATVSDPAGAMKASLSLLNLAPLLVTYALWGVTFLSPLCEWLRWLKYEPKFLLWIYGYTGSRKTSLATLFLSHFGTFLNSPPASFKDTANTLEMKGFVTKDSLLLIDDFHPTNNPQEGKLMSGNAQQLLRGYGDRVGRGRMTRDIRFRQDNPPQGMALVTAEDLITGGSSIARLFSAELKPHDVNLALLTTAQNQSPRLSEAMVGYLEWLSVKMLHREDQLLTNTFELKRSEALALNIHGRLVDACAFLYLGLKMGLSYALSIGAVDQLQKEKHLTEAWHLFLQAAKEQGEQVTEVKATTKFISIVAELYASGTIYTVSTRKNDRAPDPSHGTKVGWHDKDYYYFLPDVLYNAVSRFLGGQGKQFPISEAVLWKQLAEDGISVPETSTEDGRERKHNLVKRNLDGTTGRKLRVRAEFLKGPAEETENKLRVRPTAKGSSVTESPFSPEDRTKSP